jgi:succinate dehydrogenase flavin-adding protein (antitoxin of CptAB toxin-antitoxin module)
LAGPTYFIEKAWEVGEYEKAANELENLMSEQGLDTPEKVEFDLTNAERGMYAVDVILGKWDNFEAVVDYYDDEAPKSLFGLLEDIDAWIITKENIDESIDDEFLVHVFESLPIGIVISSARAMDIEPSEDQHKMARKIAKKLAQEKDKNRFYEYVVDAAHKAIDSSAVNHQIEKVKEQIIDRLEAYASEGIRVQPHSVYVGETDKSNPVFGPWRMSIGMRELLNIVAAGMTGGGEDAYEDEDYYAWSQWTSGYHGGIQLDDGHHGSSDHRGEYGNFPDMKLGGTNEKDKLAAEFDKDQLTLFMDQLISNTTAILNQTLRTGITPASDHGKQKELSLEAQRKEALFQKELMEIKRLAGLSLVLG